MGWIIKGMDTRPITVEIHLFFKATLLVLFCTNCTAAQILLIVKPGMITDANDCHNKVSVMESAVFFVTPGPILF